MRLRPYQSETGAAWFDLRASKPAPAGLVVCATGCGKTFLGIQIARGSGRTAWFAGREELIDQPLNLYRALFPEADCGVVKAAANGVSARDFVVVSQQTVARRKRLEALVDSGPFDLLVFDEAQHAVSSTMRRVREAFADVPLLGLTATPERTDGLNLGAVFTDGIVYSFPIAKAVAAGWLVPPVDLQGRPFRSERLVLPQYHPDEVRRSLGHDPSDEEVEAAFGEAGVEAAVRGCRLAMDAGRTRTICFVPTVDIARRVAEALGADAAWCSGATPTAERRDTLARLRRGELRCVVNCMLWVEGLDVPELDALVMARPTTSRPWYIQAAGRILRPVCTCGKILNGHPCSCAKPNALVVDLVGAHDAHGLTVTVDQLEGYDPDLEGGVRGEGGARSPQFVERPDNPRLARLYNYLRAVAGEGVVGTAPPGSDLTWLCVAPGRCYVLPAGRAGSVLIELAGVDADGETWRVVREPRNRKEAAELLGVERGVEAAQARGEAYAVSARAGGVARRDAAWREGEPSDQLLAALAKWRVWQRPRTAGEASDLLSIAAARSRFGAREKGKRAVINPWSPW